ncbi:asparagine synthase (glutamine-hydrolyzing) [Anaerobacillus sp. CMMVII]|uniref:asparagine synthase (glutamine-hydrolyzing) n=1 Tax=Anaerobacillus sp. CMMVII TaxID=2755588 RepID=UPI0021B6FA22|nr:asparagine synthase (glutamine-hydrolyzing) [Anaerobacillus sp. CMMVII]MCT8137679.1 asparagine synthase (glutamine-hydrolyzing) [Anaerobacillus sp. CMMVII]
MCGFVGILRNENVDKINSVMWDEALQAINHRGPDATGEYKDTSVEFGFKRLSIIDLEHGNQPLSYLNRYHIIFNGEIYNHVELRKELTEIGYSFQTMSDTEVILALYAHKGTECVHELRGMFAFAIWDTETETLFAARDSFGIKPFYFFETEERLFFASEQKSIKILTEHHELSQENIQHYLTYQYVPEPRCLSKDIHKLSPGHFLIKKQNEKAVTSSYYKKSFAPLDLNFSEFTTKIRMALEDSVAKHMRSDVPVGAFLSSGIDSTTIVALAKEHNPNLKTFTVGFETEGFSEVDIAKETAEKLGVENIHKLITPEEFVGELKNIIWHMDDPVADPAAVPLYFVAKEASKHVKVVLSGEGADELFGGYNIYREPLALSWFERLPKWLKVMMNRLALTLPNGVKGRSYILRGTTPLSERYIGNAYMFSEQEKKRILSNYRPNGAFTEVTKSLYQDSKQYNETSKMQYIDLHTWLPGDILVKADRMTMAHSLELRVPFLDKEVFDVARQIPDHMKISHGTTKYVLREAVKGLVPDSVLYRKKLGFPVPIRHWLRNELYDWAKDVIKYSATTDQIFNRSEVLALLEDHASMKTDNSRKLWTVLSFMLWYSLYEQADSLTVSEAIQIDPATYKPAVSLGV